MGVRSTETTRVEARWEGVATALRRAIVLGELAAGFHIKEPLLAQRFGVSRLPVREAIVRLEREGLVRVEPRRGAFVVGITGQSISDLYLCRLMLEMYAIRRVVAQIDEAGIASLQTLVDQMATAGDGGQLPSMAAADMAFHRTLIVLSHNRALLRAWQPIAPLIETLLTISDAIYESPGNTVGGHNSIVCALAQHDEHTTEMLLQDHLANAERVIHESFATVGDR